MKNNLQEKIKSFPNSPGVYQFIDQSGDILYVGKAKNLKNRIKSYFLKEIGRGPWIDLMVETASEVNYVETESEIEAVLLEADLIRDLKPKYNIRLKDDKSFLVIKILKEFKNRKEKSEELAGIKMAANYPEMFSSVELVRAKNVDYKDKSARYFGPYPAGELLRKSLHYLRKIFPYRDCSKTKYNTYRKKGRPCIYGDIRVCTAPCADWVNQDQYQKNINYLIDFLRGKKQTVIKKLKTEMAELSKQRRFEEASLVRDRLNALDHLKDIAIGIRDDVFNGYGALFKRIECYDISNIGGEYVVGSMVVFTGGKPDKEEYRKFKIKAEIDEEKADQGIPRDDLARLKQVLERRFKNDWPLPDLLVIDGGQNQLNVAREVLKSNNLNIPAVSIAKGPERKKNEFFFSQPDFAKYFINNIDLQNIIISARDEAHRFAISYYRLLHKKGMFE